MNDHKDKTNSGVAQAHDNVSRAPTSVARGGGTAIENWFLTRRIEAQERAVVAAQNLAHAQIELVKIKAVLNPISRGQIEQTERDRVEAIQIEQSLRLAQTRVDMKKFEFKAEREISDAELEALKSKEKLDAFKRKSTEGKPETVKAQKKLKKAQKRLSKLNKAYIKIMDDPDFDEVMERDMNRQVNAAKEAVEAAEAALHAERYSGT